MLSWLILAELDPGRGFGVEGAFGIRVLVSKIEHFFHGLVETGSGFLNKMARVSSRRWANVES